MTRYFFPILSGLLSLVLVSAASGADLSSAPFGLEWGMSPEAAQAAGVKLDPAKSEDGTKAFAAQGLPKILGDVERVILNFGYSGKLWKVVAISRSYPNDPFGNAITARYDELAELLASKYGKGQATHTAGDSIYKEQRYFLSGVQGGHRSHYTDFRADGVFIQLGLRASSGDTGFWVLIYENRALSSDFEKEKKEREKKSL